MNMMDSHHHNVIASTLPPTTPMPPELSLVAPRETHIFPADFRTKSPLNQSLLSTSRTESSNCVTHRTDRDLITIIRAVLAENPYQVPKVERGPVWRRVIKRLSRDGLVTNTKVVRQRLRRNLRAYRDRKRTGNYKAVSSVDLEKDALLDRLEVVAKQSQGSVSPLPKQSITSSSCSMAPSAGVLATVKGNLVDWKGDREISVLARSPIIPTSTRETYQAPKVLKVILPAHIADQNERWCQNGELAVSTHPVPGVSNTNTAYKKRVVCSFEPSTFSKCGEGRNYLAEKESDSLADHSVNLESRSQETRIEFDNNNLEVNGQEESGYEVTGGVIQTPGEEDALDDHVHECHVQMDDDHYLSSEDGEDVGEMRNNGHGLDVRYREWDRVRQNGIAAVQDFELRKPSVLEDLAIQQMNDFHRPTSLLQRRPIGRTMSSASISEDEQCLAAVAANDYLSLNNHRFSPSRSLSIRNDSLTEAQKLQLWKEELTLAKERFAQELTNRKQEQDSALAREKFERELAVQRLTFEAEQRDKDREAETKRQMLQLKCQSEMQEMQIRAQQEQTRLMLEMIKLLRHPNGTG